MHLSLFHIVVAAIAAMVISTVWYMAWGRQMAALHPAYADPSARPQPWKVAVELARCLVLAHIVAWLAYSVGVDDAGGAVVLALVLWVGFPVVLWTGACVWERVPLELAAIHAGDWLIKLLAVTLIVTLFG